MDEFQIAIREFICLFLILGIPIFLISLTDSVSRKAYCDILKTIKIKGKIIWQTFLKDVANED